MSYDFGIDLGTDRTIIYSGKAMVLDEPSVIAVETHTGEPISVGKEAEPMIGRTPDRITAVRPIERGAIADYEMAEQMMRLFLSKICNNRVFKAKLMVVIPAGITEMQEHSIVNACTAAGARDDIYLIESPIAAAVGLGIDFSTPHGSMVVDIGAGTTDIATLSMGGLTKFESIPTAGQDFNEAIVRYVRKEYGVLIGPHTAENIKRQIGCVKERPLELILTAKGQNRFSGLPQVFEISSKKIYEVLTDTAEQICKSVRSIIESTPPEMVGDIYSDGLTLTGGGALLFGMPEFLSENVGVKVNLVDSPVYCVAKGLGAALKNHALLMGESHSRLKDAQIKE